MMLCLTPYERDGITGDPNSISSQPKAFQGATSPKDLNLRVLQVHGFSDASEDAYAGVMYLRAADVSGSIHSSIVVSKTKVSPIKRLSIPHLELCGAQVVAELLDHMRNVLQVPLSDVFAWTDSTIVLNWLVGSPRRILSSSPLVPLNPFDGMLCPWCGE